MLLFIILIIALIYTPSLNLFFSADDWFHLKISQISSWPEFVNFFSFTPNPQSAAFYRPLSTQVFFFTFQKIFGLNHLPYHLFVLFIFTLNLYLIYRLSKIITKNNRLSLITVLLYGVSVSNFTRVYFLSAFQEISLVFFSLLSLLFYLKKDSSKNYFLSLLFFIAALLSKETAVTLPLIFLLTDWYKKSFKLKRFLPFIVILVIYLYLRLAIFGSVSGDSYLWSLSPIKTINTFFWYLLWSLGAPETLVDYVGNNLYVLPRFFSDFGPWAYTILVLLFSNIIFITSLIIRNVRLIFSRINLYAATFFIIALLPVLFLPWHKFTLELGLPLIGFCLFLSLIFNYQKKLGFIAIFLFLLLNLSMHYFTYERHYAVNRAKISQQISQYFLENYPNYPENSYFEFINDTEDYGSDWGASKQISHITSGSNLFQIIYNKPEIKIYFADYSEERPKDKQRIEISTKQFFQ